MLSGFSSINLDAKGRLAIPTRYRSELQALCKSRLVVTLAVNDKGGSQAGCLWLYPQPEWEQVEQKLNALPTMNRQADMLRQFIIGYASEVEMDAQGRFMLPEKLRDVAKLEKQIVLLGQLKKFEIWNDQVWTQREGEWLGSEDVGGLEQFADLSF